MAVVYKDDNWEIYEGNGCLRITYDKDGFPETIELTPEMMKSKLMDLLRDLPEGIWSIKKY